MIKSIIVHGHRGSRGTSPENTLRSFMDAHEAGAEFVELDVHLNKDHELIVFHDFEISDRLCKDEKGNPVKNPVLVRDLTTVQLKTYTCGAPDAKIPTLEELILWKKNKAPGLRLNIEIKNSVEADPTGDHAKMLPHAVIELLKKHEILEESLVQSFDFRVVNALRGLDKNVKLSCLFEHKADFAKETVSHGAQVAAVQHKLLNQENVKACHDAGLEVLPWTVNDEKDWKRMFEIGVTSIITDFPKRLRMMLSK